MKVIIIIGFILVFSVPIFSQDYQRLLKEGNKWNYLDLLATLGCQKAGILSGNFYEQFNPECGEYEERTYSLFLSGDTIINDVNYVKLLCNIIKYNKTEIVYAAAIREDTLLKNVYIKLPYQEENPGERILYSFNVEIGDTISIDTSYYSDEVTIRYIKSTGDFDFSGFSGKKIFVCDSLFRLNISFPPYEIFTDEWYEGIGSMKGLFDLTAVGAYGLMTDLLCFWNFENEIYSNPDFSECEYAVYMGIEDELSEYIFNVYPNPVNRQLNINTNQLVGEIELYDLNGKLLLSSRELNLDLVEINDGLYILKVYFESGKVSHQKIVKNSGFN